MIPSCNHLLKTIGMALERRHIPAQQTAHAQMELMLTNLTLDAIAEEVDRAAHRRILENSVLRKIFRQALDVVTDDGLKRRLAEALEKTETDFHISALDQVNFELKEMLIDLHAHVEELEGSLARKLEETIWMELEEQVKRREFMLTL